MKKNSLVFLLIFLSAMFLYGQNSLNVVQFSGMVVGGDSLYGIPGVTIYVPKAGRGTITNDIGFYSMPTLAGDTVVVQALGYKRKSIVVPKSDKQSVTMIVELVEDTIYLPIIEIFPYPTEELFKQAFLSLNLSDEYIYTRMANNLDAKTLLKMIRSSSLSSKENAQYSLRNQLIPGNTSYGQGFQGLNPFAWSNLVKSIRKNKTKSKYDSYE